MGKGNKLIQIGGGQTMKKAAGILCIGLFFLAIGVIWAEERGTAAQARLMVERAAEFARTQGREKAIAEFNNPKGQFVRGELYVYAWDVNGNVLAMVVNPKMIGSNVLNSPDADGKLFRKEAIELAKAKGSGWVDYKYQNPRTKQLDQKTAYVKKVDDLVIGCGAYK